MMSETCRLNKELEILESNISENYTLYEGKTGLSIACCLLGRLTGEKKFDKKAGTYLDDLAEHIGSVKETTFGHGLSGIGWAIEWLNQQKMITVNTNEVLEDMDDELYKAVIFSLDISAATVNHAIGLGLYFYRRLTAVSAAASRYRRLCNQECLTILIDKLHEHLSNEVNSGAKLKNAAAILLFTARIEHLALNQDQVKNIIRITLSRLSYHIKNLIIEPQSLEKQYPYILYAYESAGRFLSDSAIQFTARQARRHIRTQISAANMEGPDHLPEKQAAPTIYNLLRSIDSAFSTSRLNWDEGWSF